MIVLTKRWFSTAIRRMKSVNVVLPSGYSERRTYPVLYLLHGYGGNRNTWLTGTALVDHVRRHDMIVVLPESGRYWFINDHEGRRYEDYLIGEVLSHIEEIFPARRSRESRAIGGFSMGGAAAMSHALRHPDLFCAVASHSGAFHAPRRVGDPYAMHRTDPGFVMPTVEAHDKVWGPPGSPTRRAYDPEHMLSEYDRDYPLGIYLDVGKHDYEQMISMNRSMRDALRVAGLAHEYHERAGGHDWAYVNASLPAALNFVDDHLSQCDRTLERVNTKEKVKW